MAYDEGLAERVRSYFGHRRDVEEKQMFSGLTFMVNGKMCVGVHTDKLMARIHPDETANALKQRGVRQMDFTGKPMKGYIFVSLSALDKDADLHHWLDMALAFNSEAKAAKKPMKKDYNKENA